MADDEGLENGVRYQIDRIKPITDLRGADSEGIAGQMQAFDIEAAVLWCTNYSAANLTWVTARQELPIGLRRSR